MNQQIAALLAVQEVDRKIIRLEKKLDQRPKALAALERDSAQKQESLQAKTQVLKDVQVKIGLKEVDLKEHEARINKLTMQKFAPKISNKEFQARSHEIESEKVSSSFIQDEIIKMLTEQEQNEKELAAAKEEADKAANLMEKERTAAEQELARIRADLAMLSAERKKAIGGVPKDLLGFYERIMRSKGDSALAEVVDNVCQGCYISLTPQMSLSVRTGNDVVPCQSCGRLLYRP